MKDLNEVYLIGRAVDDIKVYEFETKKKYFFKLAVNFYSNSNEKEYVEYIPVVIWSQDGNKYADSIKKGDNVAVNGRISISYYEKENQKHTNIELVSSFFKVFKTKSSIKTESELIDIIIKNEPLHAELLNSKHVMLSDKIKAKLKK